MVYLRIIHEVLLHRDVAVRGRAVVAQGVGAGEVSHARVARGTLACGSGLEISRSTHLGGRGRPRELGLH